MPHTHALDRESQLRAEVGRLEALLRAATAEQDRLTFELGHRVKNTLSVVQALASQTMRSAASKEEALEAFGGRVMALARANDAILAESWTTATIRSVAEGVLAPFMTPPGRLSIDGPDTRLKAGAALSVAMALYELAANAKSYGAWSVEGGHVDLRWSVEPGDPEGGFRLSWRETGGPQVGPPDHRGFGLRMTEQSLKSAFGRNVTFDFAATGLICVVQAPLSKLAS